MGSSELEFHCKNIRDGILARQRQLDPRLDSTIQSEVWLTFWEADDAKALDISQIEVIVRQCEVWLSGQVGDDHARQLAECLVNGIAGVRKCHNELAANNREESSDL
jgi:osmotically-inducible protein OsmY